MDSKQLQERLGKMIHLIDTHCHLDAPEFTPDRAAVMARARAAGVWQQVIPAVSAAGWEALAQVCADAPGLHPAYGLHPMYLDEHRPEHLDLLQARLRAQRPLAVGEAGLDFYVETLDRAGQQFYFEAQLRLAAEHELPVILHARRAVDAVIAAVRRIRVPGGVIHSYAGSFEQAVQLDRLGFCLGFGGPLTYPRANRLRELVARLPAHQLLIETDAPDQPLCGHQGQRNEPARLPYVLHTLAELRGLSPAALAVQLNANARAVFGPALAAPVGLHDGEG